MTLRPIDLQTMMPKTTEVSKIQHLQKENTDIQKSILATGFQEQLRLSRQKVNKRSKPEEIKIEEEQQNSNEYDKNKGKKQNKRQAKSRGKTASFINPSRYIDIKI